ncbi:MAG: UDP-2,3-diacylglucosamine diphosphatase [Burkholderiaceae bacterium]
MADIVQAHFSEWVAPASCKGIEFISDLHLSAQTPGTLDAWERYLGQTRAGAVFILGDLFESWAGDDSRVCEFEAHCVDVLAQAAARTSLAFMLGNRDFLIGSDMLAACRMQLLADPTVLVAFGQRYLLSHGDALCLEDTEYQQFRAMVRDPQWQRELLARPLQERRELAREMRAASMQHQRGRPADSWFDIDKPTAIEWLDRAGSRTLIHGHTHRPGSDYLAPGYLRHVLSDWSAEAAESPRAEVLRLGATCLRRQRLT